MNYLSAQRSDVTTSPSLEADQLYIGLDRTCAYSSFEECCDNMQNDTSQNASPAKTWIYPIYDKQTSTPRKTRKQVTPTNN